MMGYKFFLAAVLSLPLTGVFAHGDEQHGEAPALSANTRSLPSAEAHSADFELVAQLQGDRLTVYLDNYGDNQPVLGANIEVESDSFKASLAAVAPGTYQVNASALNHPGEHSLLFTVLAGEQSDLLDTVLNVSAAEAEPAAASSQLWWWGAAALLLIVAGLLFKGRRRLGLVKQGVAAL
jgi:hypothetical protein